MILALDQSPMKDGQPLRNDIPQNQYESNEVYKTVLEHLLNQLLQYTYSPLRNAFKVFESFSARILYCRNKMIEQNTGQEFLESNLTGITNFRNTEKAIVVQIYTFYTITVTFICSLFASITCPIYDNLFKNIISDLSTILMLNLLCYALLYSMFNQGNYMSAFIIFLAYLQKYLVHIMIEEFNEIHNFISIISFIHSFPLIIKRYLSAKDHLPLIATVLLLALIYQNMRNGFYLNPNQNSNELVMYLQVLNIIFFYWVDSFQVKSMYELEVQTLVKENKDLVNKIDNYEIHVASLIHELRNPLLSIISAISLLRSNQIEKNNQSEELFEVANSCGDHLNTMINNMLEYSKLKAHKIELNKTSVDILQNVRSILKMNYFKSKENGNKIQLFVSTNFPKKVIIDEQRLKQILINLISNAIKFTQNGTITLSLGWKSDSFVNNSNLDLTSEIKYEEDKQLFRRLENNIGNCHSHKEDNQSDSDSQYESGSRKASPIFKSDSRGQLDDQQRLSYSNLLAKNDDARQQSINEHRNNPNAIQFQPQLKFQSFNTNQFNNSQLQNYPAEEEEKDLHFRAQFESTNDISKSSPFTKLEGKFKNKGSKSSPRIKEKKNELEIFGIKEEQVMEPGDNDNFREFLDDFLLGPEKDEDMFGTPPSRYVKELSGKNILNINDDQEQRFNSARSNINTSQELLLLTSRSEINLQNNLAMLQANETYGYKVPYFPQNMNPQEYEENMRTYSDFNVGNTELGLECKVQNVMSFSSKQIQSSYKFPKKYSSIQFEEELKVDDDLDELEQQNKNNKDLEGFKKINKINKIEIEHEQINSNESSLSFIESHIQQQQQVDNFIFSDENKEGKVKQRLQIIKMVNFSSKGQEELSFDNDKTGQFGSHNNDFDEEEKKIEYLNNKTQFADFSFIHKQQQQQINLLEDSGSAMLQKEGQNLNSDHHKITAFFPGDLHNEGPCKKEVRSGSFGFTQDQNEGNFLKLMNKSFQKDSQIELGQLTLTKQIKSKEKSYFEEEIIPRSCTQLVNQLQPRSQTESLDFKRFNSLSQKKNSLAGQLMPPFVKSDSFYKGGSSKKGTLIVEVKDTGRGITEEGLKKLFKPFAQEDPTISKNYGGTGLGLCICHDLVTIMNGEIQVKSVRKLGTSFILTIPLQVSNEITGLIDESDLDMNQIDLDYQNYELVVCNNQQSFGIQFIKKQMQHKVQNFKLIEQSELLLLSQDQCKSLFTKVNTIKAIIIDYQSIKTNPNLLTSLSQVKEDYLDRQEDSGDLYDLKNYIKIPVIVLITQNVDEQKIRKQNNIFVFRSPFNQNTMQKMIVSIKKYYTSSGVSDQVVKLNTKYRKRSKTEDNKSVNCSEGQIYEDRILPIQHQTLALSQNIRVSDLQLNSKSTNISQSNMTFGRINSDRNVPLANTLALKKKNQKTISFYSNQKYRSSQNQRRDSIKRMNILQTQIDEECLSQYENQSHLHLESLRSESSSLSVLNKVAIKNSNQQKILIVNDNPMILIVLEKMIENAIKEVNQNIVILRAKNGKEALEIYQQCTNIKCILMDINMPLMNGFDCTSSIRAYEEEKNKSLGSDATNTNMAFIIGVSGNSDKGYVRRCQQVGMNDQLTTLPNVKKIKEILLQVYS